MTIDILELNLKGCNKKLGTVLVKYHEMIMKCDLVYHPKSNKAWIRMPELWKGEKKLRYCYWPNKNSSDEFQKTILNKIFDKYSLDINKIQDLHQQNRLEMKQKSRQDIKKKLL